MKTMSRESMDKVVSDHFRYEATDDIEGVLRTFTDDAEHFIALEVVARGGIEPPTRKVSVRGSARFGITRPKIGTGFPRADRTSLPDRTHTEPAA